MRVRVSRPSCVFCLLRFRSAIVFAPEFESHVFFGVFSPPAVDVSFQPRDPAHNHRTSSAPVVSICPNGSGTAFVVMRPLRNAAFRTNRRHDCGQTEQSIGKRLLLCVTTRPCTTPWKSARIYLGSVMTYSRGVLFVYDHHLRLILLSRFLSVYSALYVCSWPQVLCARVTPYIHVYSNKMLYRQFSRLYNNALRLDYYHFFLQRSFHFNCVFMASLKPVYNFMCLPPSRVYPSIRRALYPWWLFFLLCDLVRGGGGSGGVHSTA